MLSILVCIASLGHGVDGFQSSTAPGRAIITTRTHTHVHTHPIAIRTRIENNGATTSCTSLNMAMAMDDAAAANDNNANCRNRRFKNLVSTCTVSSVKSVALIAACMINS